MQLRPGTAVTWRAPGVTQVGTHPQGCVVLRDTTLAQHAWLKSCARNGTPLGLVEAGNVCLPERQRILRRLAIAGLVDTDLGPSSSAAAQCRPQAGTALSSVRIDGITTVSEHIAALMAAQGAHSFELRDTSRAHTLAPGASPGAIAKALMDRHRGIHFTRLDRPAVVVLSRERTSDLVECGRLMAADIPHLLITTIENGIDVGPVVVPGVTPCATCMALERRDSDPSFALFDVLAGARRPPLSGPSPAAAASAAAAALMLLSRRPGPVAQSLFVADDLSVTATAHMPHPECGCGAVAGAGTSASSS